MNTKRMLAVAAFATGLLLSAPSYAGMIIIDDFSEQQSPVVDVTADGIAVSSTNTVRTISHNLLSPDSPIQSVAEVSQGHLLATNGVNENSSVSVSWLLKEGLFTGKNNADLSFTIFESGAEKTNIKFLFANAELANFDIPQNATNKVTSFALSPSQLLAINGGGTLALEINGASGWNVGIDTVGFNIDNKAANVPEPALMGMVGVSLTALGLIRRKKQN